MTTSQLRKRKIEVFPVVTEKASSLQATANQYAFYCDLNANKLEIKDAVEALKSGIKVEEIRTLVLRGKVKRMGRSIGKRSNRKKAFVRLAAGQTLELFESV